MSEANQLQQLLQTQLAVRHLDADHAGHHQSRAQWRPPRIGHIPGRSTVASVSSIEGSAHTTLTKSVQGKRRCRISTCACAMASCSL